MFIDVVTTVSDTVFSFLEPRHLEDLRLVNRAMAACITKRVQDQSVKEALAKYKRMVVLTNNTVRIHSSLGHTRIDLILPNGNGVTANPNAGYSMRLHGRLYRGWAHDGRRALEAVFFRNSPTLFTAERVSITELLVFPMFDAMRISLQVQVECDGVCSSAFSFCFRSAGW